MRSIFLVLSAFLASAVEMVEALTVVLAAGVTRGWRSALLGAAAAAGTLAVVVLALGPALTLVPIDGLRVVVGVLLVVFGGQWLRKAVLRAAGRKALHDEDAIYQRELAEAQQSRTDWYGFSVSFKGVFLEGLEVALIVVTFGSAQGSVVLASVGAAAAVVLVAAVGFFVHRPLSRVPENTMKFAVGVMLTTFGIFWTGEGAGVGWPGGDLAIPVVLAVVLAAALGSVAALRATRRPEVGALTVSTPS